MIDTNKRFLIAGQFTLVFGIVASLLNSYYFNHIPILDFLSGAFIGLSMVMNLTFLIRYSHARKRE